MIQFNNSLSIACLILVPASLFLSACQSGGDADTADATDAGSEQEAATPDKSEWITLFDGTSLSGWKRFNADEIGKMWKVEDGMIACYSEGGGEASEEDGALITEEQFDNFEFSVEWKISPRWQQRLEASKWKNYPDWCKAKTGSIGLQDHGSPIWFRKVKRKISIRLRMANQSAMKHKIVLVPFPFTHSHRFYS